MPLSKARDKARKKQSRLDAKNNSGAVQPKVAIYKDTTSEPEYIDAPNMGLGMDFAWLDADGNPVYND